MNEFEKYLIDKKFSFSTISTYCYLVSKYLDSIDKRTISKINYNSIVKYITYLRKNNNDVSINLHLVAIRHYFNFKNLKYNPVKTHIKRKPTVINSNTFTQEQLENIYDSFVCDDTSTSVRDKVLLGLFVFQGIQPYEVKYIKVSDIDFDKLSISICQTTKSNSRVVPLNIKQVLLLNEYITVKRNELVSNHKEQSELLIITSKSKNCTRSILNQLHIKIANLPNKPNLRLLRTSVIRNWLKSNDVRNVQYLAGHKYISSTERYVIKDIEQLKKKVLKYHPL